MGFQKRCGPNTKIGKKMEKTFRTVCVFATTFLIIPGFVNCKRNFFGKQCKGGKEWKDRLSMQQTGLTQELVKVLRAKEVSAPRRGASERAR